MYNKPYTEEQIAFIRRYCPEMAAAELVLRFNEHFGETRTKKGLQNFIRTLGLQCIRPKNTWANRFSDVQKAFLFQYGPQMSRIELTKLFNQHFHDNCSLNTIKGFCTRHKIPSPNGDGRFTTETSPRWQKGLSTLEFKQHYTEQSFQKLTSPMIKSNIKYNVGDELIRHGQPYIVVSNNFGHGIDARLKPKDIYIWEQHNGPIPQTHMLIHLDNDPMNCKISNLRCIPRKFRAFFRHNDWWNSSPEIKELAINWCELYYIIQSNQ